MTPAHHRRVALSLAATLTLVALLHAYWALGGNWGLAEALGGAHRPVPPSWAIWLVAALLVAAVLIVLGRLGIWGAKLPNSLFRLACWGLAVALFLAAALNLTGRTAWERFGFGPFAALLGLAAAITARSPRRAT